MDLLALQHEVDSFVLGPCDWYHHWHKHVDWEREGNNDHFVRRACLEALVAMMLKARKQLHGGGPYQVWLRVDESDSGQDCFFVHTPNPHSDFPFGFDQVTWGGDIPDIFSGIVDPKSFRVGRSVWEGDRTFWLCPLD